MCMFSSDFIAACQIEADMRGQAGQTSLPMQEDSEHSPCPDCSQAGDKMKLPVMAEPHHLGAQVFKFWQLCTMAVWYCRNEVGTALPIFCPFGRHCWSVLIVPAGYIASSCLLPTTIPLSTIRDQILCRPAQHAVSPMHTQECPSCCVRCWR